MMRDLSQEIIAGTIHSIDIRKTQFLMKGINI